MKNQTFTIGNPVLNTFTNSGNITEKPMLPVFPKETLKQPTAPAHQSTGGGEAPLLTMEQIKDRKLAELEAERAEANEEEERMYQHYLKR